MRVIVGSVVAASLALALAGCGKVATSSAQASGGETQGQTVVAIGCPKTPQPGCTTIVAKGKAYDITGAGVDTTRGVALSVTGKAGGEVGACGPKLTDVKVEYQTLRCAPPAAATPPA